MDHMFLCSCSWVARITAGLFAGLSDGRTASQLCSFYTRSHPDRLMIKTIRRLTFATASRGVRPCPRAPVMAAKICNPFFLGF